MSDGECVGDGGHEHGEVSDPGVPFTERACQEARRVFRGEVREFCVGSFHLHIDGQPVPQVTVSVIEIMMGNRVGSERCTRGEGKRGVKFGFGDDARTSFRVETPACDIVEAFVDVEETT